MYYSISYDVLYQNFIYIFWSTINNVASAIQISELIIKGLYNYNISLLH